MAQGGDDFTCFDHFTADRALFAVSQAALFAGGSLAGDHFNGMAFGGNFFLRLQDLAADGALFAFGQAGLFAGGILTGDHFFGMALGRDLFLLFNNLSAKFALGAFGEAFFFTGGQFSFTDGHDLVHVHVNGVAHQANHGIENKHDMIAGGQGNGLADAAVTADGTGVLSVHPEFGNAVQARNADCKDTVFIGRAGNDRSFGLLNRKGSVRSLAVAVDRQGMGAGLKDDVDGVGAVVHCNTGADPVNPGFTGKGSQVAYGERQCAILVTAKAYGKRSGSGGGNSSRFGRGFSSGFRSRFGRGFRSRFGRGFSGGFGRRFRGGFTGLEGSAAAGSAKISDGSYTVRFSIRRDRERLRGACIADIFSGIRAVDQDHVHSHCIRSAHSQCAIIPIGRDAGKGRSTHQQEHHN